LTPEAAFRLRSVAGYLSLAVGWVEGFEINFFGAVLDFDIRQRTLKFPGIGSPGITFGI
jgi:hypothetical protein